MKKIFAVAVFIVHRLVETLKFGQNCPKCAEFKDNKTKYSLELRRNLSYGMCDKHIVIYKFVMNLDIKTQVLLEQSLGFHFEDHHLFCYLPDGRLCTMRSITWGEHLIQLAKEK